ncbi:MAG: regulatory protein RecX, partial [Candidatus Gracilibacteria bacterium]
MNSDPLNPKHAILLTEYSLRLLSRRSYTMYEMEKKLRQRFKKFFNPGEGIKTGVEGAELGQDPVPSILSRLQTLGYLNDPQFCERWVEERCRLRPRGKYALTQELRKKGIPKEVLDSYWEGREKSNNVLDELPLASRLIEKKRSLLEKRYEPYQVKQKLSFYLASRGFSPDT